MPEPKWEHFQHRADVGVRGRGPTLESAFERAALALTAVMTDPQHVRAQVPVPIECRGQDPEFLLVEWLDSLIYETATRKMLFSRFQVNIENGRLQATAWGEPVDLQRHQPAVEIKGATLTCLRVVREKDGDWVAQCVVDV